MSTTEITSLSETMTNFLKYAVSSLKITYDQDKKFVKMNASPFTGGIRDYLAKIGEHHPNQEMWFFPVANMDKLQTLINSKYKFPSQQLESESSKVSLRVRAFIRNISDKKEPEQEKKELEVTTRVSNLETNLDEICKDVEGHFSDFENKREKVEKTVSENQAKQEILTDALNCVSKELSSLKKELSSVQKELAVTNYVVKHIREESKDSQEEESKDSQEESKDLEKEEEDQPKTGCDFDWGGFCFLLKAGLLLWLAIILCFLFMAEEDQAKCHKLYAIKKFVEFYWQCYMRLIPVDKCST